MLLRGNNFFSNKYFSLYNLLYMVIIVQIFMSVALGNDFKHSNVSCDVINGVYLDEGEVEFAYFQGEPAVGLEKGKRISLSKFIFHLSKISGSNIWLSFDKNTHQLVVGKIPNFQDDIVEKWNAVCIENALFYKDEREGTSDGSSYHLKSEYKLFVDSNGDLIVEWSVKSKSRSFFGTVTSQNGKAKFTRDAKGQVFSL